MNGSNSKPTISYSVQIRRAVFTFLEFGDGIFSPAPRSLSLLLIFLLKMVQIRMNFGSDGMRYSQKVPFVLISAKGKKKEENIKSHG